MAIRVPINLASEPFRRDRPLFILSIAACLILVVTLGLEINTILRERRQASSTRAGIARVNAQLRTLGIEQSKLDGTLRRPENAEVLERSVFLNELIERKSISWTRIFADLEKVLPYNLRLISVRLPEVNSQNQVFLDVVVSAKDVAPVLDFLRKLEASPQFGPTSFVNSLPPSQTDPFYRYHVTVSYAQKL
jgi:type IV pilus assembly protein PilN